MNNKGLLDAAKSAPHIPYITKEDNERLQYQWMSFLATQHPLSHDDMMPQILIFVWHLRIDLDGNYMR